MRVLSSESVLVFFLIFKTLSAFSALFFGIFFLFVLPNDELRFSDWLLTFLASKALAMVLFMVAYAFFRLAQLDYAYWVENY